MNIVITGASSGIGKVIGEYLLTRGHQVIGTSRYHEGPFGHLELLRLDVTSDESVEEFTQTLGSRFDRIDVLINNAGFALCGPIENTSIAECKEQFETNYFGVVRVTTSLLPFFRKQRTGKIITISSLAGLIGMPFQAHYSASKFALEGFTEALRMELSPFHIQACTINPGDFHTSFTANRKMASSIDPAYSESCGQLLAQYEEEERNGSDPILIAKLVASLIQRKRLKVRYIVGKPSQTVSVTLKRIFGESLFEKVMKLIWKIN